MSDLTDQEEQELNPAPKSYRVSLRIKWWFLGFALVGFGLYGYVLADRRMAEHRFIQHQEIAPIKLMPTPMPPLAVINPETGQPKNLAFNNGTYILLNIWATWCPPCQKEMPSLSLLQEHLQGKLRVIALSVDDDINAVTDFMTKNQLKFSVLWDKDKASLRHLGVEKYPETFLISPDGNLATQFSGPRDWASPQVFDYFLNALP